MIDSLRLSHMECLFLHFPHYTTMRFGSKQKAYHTSFTSLNTPLFVNDKKICAFNGK